MWLICGDIVFGVVGGSKMSKQVHCWHFNVFLTLFWGVPGDLTKKVRKRMTRFSRTFELGRASKGDCVTQLFPSGLSESGACGDAFLGPVLHWPLDSPRLTGLPYWDKEEEAIHG